LTPGHDQTRCLRAFIPVKGPFNCLPKSMSSRAKFDTVW
jgi:hypothetical protein